MANEVITVNPADIEAEDWLAKRAELIERGKAITSVSTEAELEVAGKFETDCKKLVKKLGDIRKGITGPLDEAKKEIMAKEKQLAAPLIGAQTRVNGLTTAYANMLAKKAEAERLAREAAEREAAERALAEEEAARAQAEANAAFGLTPAETTPPAPPPPMPLPAVTTTGPHTSSNRFVEKWDFTITDANAVPRELCSPDPAKIRALMAAKKAEGYKASQIVVAGVRITSSVQVYAK